MSFSLFMGICLFSFVNSYKPLVLLSHRLKCNYISRNSGHIFPVQHAQGYSPSKLFSTGTSNTPEATIIPPEKEENLTKPYLILGILLLAFSSNQWSRQAIFYLCNFTPLASPINHMNSALHFSQDQYAVLASVGFTFFFALSSIIAGALTDKLARNQVLAYSCFAWSAITLLEASATDYNHLLIMRSLMAIAQSFFNPAAYTVLSDVFPKKYIGTANGILGGGVYLGGGLASLSILLDNRIGWRDTLNVIGAIGVVISILIITLVPEPKNDMKTSPSFLSTATSIIPTPEAKKNVGSVFSDNFDSVNDVYKSSGARILLAASALRFAAGFTIGVWKAPFVFEKFPGSEDLFAGSNALIVAGGGLASSLLGGYLSDLIAQKQGGSNPRARVWVPAIGSLLAAPLWVGFIQAGSPTTAAAFLLAEYLAAECWVGPTLAGLYNEVPSNRRGTAQGIFALLTAVGNVAPLLIGAIVSGQLGPGVHLALSDSLIAFVSGSYILSGLLFAYFAANNQGKGAASVVKNTEY